MQQIKNSMNKFYNNKDLQSKFNELYLKVVSDNDIQHFLINHSDLTKSDIQNSLAQLLEYIHQRNSIKKGRSGLVPGYIPRLEVSNNHIIVAYSPTKQTIENKKKNSIYNRIINIDIPDSIKDADINDYQKGSNLRLHSFMEALSFTNNYCDLPNEYHRGLYLYGPFGVGKTYLLGAIAKKLAESGYKSILLHLPTFNVEVKNSINNHNLLDNINYIKRAPVLMIDDIGADNGSAWIRDEVLGVILQYRMQEKLSTFFTSNLSIKELLKHFTVSSQGDEEPIKAQRIIERIKFLSKEIFIDGPNRRNI